MQYYQGQAVFRSRLISKENVNNSAAAAHVLLPTQYISSRSSRDLVNTPKNFLCNSNLNTSSSNSSVHMISANGWQGDANINSDEIADIQNVDDECCLVCGDKGSLLLCDFPNCPRAYHKVRNNK